jgi:flagellar hook-length control protein FliK
MMSTKTVFTETPAAPIAGGALPAAPAAPGEAGVPSQFQNLMTANVALAPEPSLIDTLPTQPLAQLLTAKPALPPRSLPVASPDAETSLPGTGNAMLQILTDSAAALTEASAGAEFESGITPEELLEGTEKSDDDLLAEWLDASLPLNFFGAVTAPGAEASGAGGESGGEGGADSKETAEAIAALLARGNAAADRQVSALVTANSLATIAADASAASMTQGAAALAKLAESAAASAAAATTVAAFSNEAKSQERTTEDQWMSALGDLKRGTEAAPAPATRTIGTPVHDARWADALAHRLVMMAREGESVASIKLVPQELGPLDIQISVRDSQATVHFGVSQNETRAVLEASLPKLREMLSSQGLELANASVSQQSPQGKEAQRSAALAGVSPVSEETDPVAKRVVSTSLLDIYA